MRKNDLCCRPVSVRLSVCLVYCIQTAEDVVKFLSRPAVAHHSSFVDAKRRYAIPGETLEHGF